MNLLFRSLYILFPPRLPRLGPEDVADTAEYYNRLATRHDEAAMDPPSMWIDRISARLTVRIRPFKIAAKVSQTILRCVAPRSKSLAERLEGTEWRMVLTSAPARRVCAWVLSTALSFFSPRSFTWPAPKWRFRNRAASDLQPRRFPHRRVLFAQKSRSILLDTHTLEGHHHVEVSPF